MLTSCKNRCEEVIYIIGGGERVGCKEVEK